MKHSYVNFSCRIFQGFYESNLFNSDMLYYEAMNYEMPEGYAFEIDDFEAYKNELGKEAVDILFDQIKNDNIIKSMTFTSILSPRYYNFETDKLEIDIDYDKEELDKFCYDAYKEDFDEYLHETYTSRDGFISFVPNNLKDFQEWSDERVIDVQIEFYLLQMIDFEAYEMDLYEEVSQTFWNHLCLEKNWELYEYTVDDQDNIIVGDKIEK